jgi:ribosomal protein L1
MRILVLADAADVNKCNSAGVEHVAFDTLATTYDKSKPGPIKSWAKKYDILLCSKS